MRIEVLGPVRAFAGDGAPIELGAMARALLARLALAGGETVPADALVDGLWGERPRGGTVNALHGLVHRLRKALGASAAVERTSAGYRLHVRAEDVDAIRFEDLAKRGRGELSAGAAQEAAALLRDALALWRADALADVRDAPFAGTAAARLEELRTAALEDRFEAELQLGHHDEILADLATASAAHPLRERLAGLRMWALHAAGRQADALAVFEQIRRTLAEQLGIDPSEELRKTHLTILRGKLHLPRAHPRAVPGRLPAQMTSFVGRQDELRLLGRLLESSRLVTVVGPGGVGKTRLALEAVSRHRANRRGRVWLVSLAGVRTADGLPEAVLGTLGVADAPPSGPPLERVAGLLAGGEGVLVLDNCEQISGPVAEFAGQLLQRQPYLTILATSREPLEVMGETLCRLGPLALPPAHGDWIRAGESAAVRLFADRATAVRPGFVLDAPTSGAVMDIVRRLDGLPLALELAAARLRTMSADQVAQRLDDRFRLLSTGNRAAQPRQQTLRAVIEWSWELLSEEEQTLARRMAIFPARTGLAAIGAVCSDAALSAGDVVYVLESLVDKSIVERAGDGYRMLETIRAYAAGELQLAGEHDAVLRRFTRHFADLAARHEPLLRSHEQAQSLRLFEAEYDNLIFALQSAIDDDNAPAAAAILAPLYWYWVMLRYDARADVYLARVAALGDALPADARAAFTAIHAVAGQLGSGIAPERLRALIDDCARTGALRRYPILLTTVLLVAAVLGLDEPVRREINRVRGDADRWAIACTYVIEAMHYSDHADREGGLAAMRQALRAFEDVGDRWWTAKTLTGLAQIHALDGDGDQAITAYERAIALAAELGSQDEISTRLALATARMRAGDLTGARHDIDTAERLAWHHGQPMLEMDVLGCLAELQRRRGDIERSEHELDRMEALARTLPLPAETIGNRLLPARLANFLTAEDAARARDLLPRAVRAAKANMDAHSAAQLLARLLLLEGDPSSAATALGLSHAIRGAFDHGDSELRSLVETLVDRLGRTGFDHAFRQGAGATPHEAMNRLTQVCA
ncbi:BTAD domain-containing putative transcriptional regulator [Nonomuraea sp. NPDC050394]|uniref:BTAD domain-containing putative transcriptional regulator n=1 Tax=Nonomuraea sp. NPDC050394 TaxID=3364363 RepID=UPI0037B97CFC